MRVLNTSNNFKEEKNKQAGNYLINLAVYLVFDVP